MNKKISIILIIILALIMGVILLVFKNSNNKKKEPVYDYLVIGDESTWKYDDGWQKCSYGEINNKTLNVYIDGSYQGEYLLKYHKGWNLFSSDKFVSYEGDLLAMSPNLGDLIDFENKTLNYTDYNIINDLLQGTYVENDFSNATKMVVDLNGDGIEDSVIYVSNLGYDDKDKYFNLLYTNINGDIQVLIKEFYEPRDYYIAPIYILGNLITLKNNVNLIVKKGYFSEVGDTGNIMYSLSNGKFELVVED